MKHETINNTSVLIQESPQAKQALILIHGRNSTAENIMSVTQNTHLPETLIIAPQAKQHTWYPARFVLSKKDNEPYLSESIEIIRNIISYTKETYNLKESDIILGGFSQGACLVAEYIKQYPTRFKGVLIMSGGIIGTNSEVRNIPTEQTLENTPIYIGCDIYDAHIPKERVELSAEIFKKMKAHTTVKIYTGLGHTIHSDAIRFLIDLI